MSLHLAEIGRQVAPGSHAALVLDGAGYHVAKGALEQTIITRRRRPDPPATS
jgi:hypothetical protein